MKKGIAVLSMVLLVASVLPVAAGRYDHARTGFFVGFGLGGGNAGIKDGDSRENGGAGSFRVGYAVRQDLVVGLENAAWVKSETVSGIDLTLSFNVATFGVTYYPGNQGLYVKGGIGFGSAKWEAAVGNAKLSWTDSGLGLLGAAGYEWRLTQKFAIGPEVAFAYLNVGGDLESADFVSGHVTFNWYW
jgi:hypothetical protein